VNGIFFADKKLRHGPSYRLVEWSELGNSEKEILSGLYDESEVYGVFMPTHPSANLTQKVAYKEIALIYLHLGHSRFLPRYFYLSSSERQNNTIAQLILEGILEIEDEGSFVSGTSAVKSIFGETLSQEAGIPGRISVLSTQAIGYGLLLRGLDMRLLSRKLYSYNTLPWDEQTRSAFEAKHSVKEFLFLSGGLGTKNFLKNSWEPNNLEEKKYWFSWWKQKRKIKMTGSSQQPTFKLYISPAIEQIPRIFELAVRILSASDAFSFKIGSTIEGLIRPDKMVAYFYNKEAMMDVAGLLSKELDDVTAHSVPFTAQIDKSGVLSWGIDPSDSEVLSSVEAGSWRMKVTDQLALAIGQAQADQLDLPRAIQFVRTKLLTLGISTTDWTALNY
jgi:hypothetical protein